MTTEPVADQPGDGTTPSPRADLEALREEILRVNRENIARITGEEMSKGRRHDGVRLDALELKVTELVDTIASLEQQVRQLLADVNGAG